MKNFLNDIVESIDIFAISPYLLLNKKDAISSRFS